jgi:Methyltransferase domain
MLSREGDLARLARRLLGQRQVNHLVRFEPVLELIADTGRAGGRLLDVGSGSQGIAELLAPGWRVTACDADFEDYGAAARPSASTAERVLGDVRALPFADRSFDVAVAVDLLEHICPEDRSKAISEICRVARVRAVIACPVGGHALAADRDLALRLQAQGRAVPGWLWEHLENGFPEIEELSYAVESFGSVRVRDNESVSAHVRLVAAELSPFPAVALRVAAQPLAYLLASRRRRGRRLAARILRWIRGNDRPPNYRAVVVVDIAANADPADSPTRVSINDDKVQSR